MSKKKLLSLGLCALMLSALPGCGEKNEAENLTRQLSRTLCRAEAPKEEEKADAADVTGFGVRLLQQSLNETSDKTKNILISPVSVLYALSMAANGAEDATLEQMEAVMGAPVSGLNDYLSAYKSALPQGDSYQLKLANSLWLRDSEYFLPKEDFLALNAGLYDADIFKAPFDRSTVRDINRWVSDKTDKMIPKAISDISAQDVMFLINALSFDAEWSYVYKSTQVHRGTFTGEDGTQYRTELMYCSEHAYLEDEYAQGFLKYYKDSKYAFAALLPREDVSVEDYVNTLTGETLHTLLSNPAEGYVQTAIPKFDISYEAELSELFKKAGMTDAFDIDRADFSGIGSSPEGNLFISAILHKTHIAVDERGTKAGAVTVVMEGAGAAMPEATVYLERPFVYMIIDCEENVPLFMGTVMSLD